MRKISLLLLILVGMGHSLHAQQIYRYKQDTFALDYENIHSSVIQHDSLMSSFIISIKKDVPLHLHQKHTELVYVLEGEGEMVLGSAVERVKSGDIIFIPANTPHSLKVISVRPMKVLSVQTPYFDGSDRVLINERP
jgi:quercetin dioxygenase-like cupin family protein